APQALGARGGALRPRSLFFFSSRRRHTRSKRDWSSDVCSSDLAEARQIALEVSPCSMFVRSDPQLLEQMIRNLLSNAIKFTKRRSEERRVGKERTSWWEPYR